MARDYTYQETRQRLLQSLRSRFGDTEMIDQTQAAHLYGYKDVGKAKAQLAQLPAYEFGRQKVRYALTDIASDLARRARYPNSHVF